MLKPLGGLRAPRFFLPLPYKPIRWQKSTLAVLDQRALPSKKVYLDIPDIPRACEAIRTLAVRGAPLVGVVAALALAHAARRGTSARELLRGIKALSRTRPTAVNLFVALARMRKVIENGPEDLLVEEALKIWEEEKQRSFAMAANGSKLIRSGMRIGTYCNTGLLAAPGLGTALGVIIKAHLDGKRIEVVVPETRPLLQGSRLTAWELEQWRIPYIVVTESALASVLAGWDACFVGADRIAASGDTANKVGTHSLAILCRHFKVPFYVVAPSSTLDLSIKDGQKIPIEQRHADEVRGFGSCAATPRKARVFNPAFDVTPAGLVTAIVTERGIITPPYKESLRS